MTKEVCDCDRRDGSRYMYGQVREAYLLAGEAEKGVPWVEKVGVDCVWAVEDFFWVVVGCVWVVAGCAIQDDSQQHIKVAYIMTGPVS